MSRRIASVVILIAGIVVATGSSADRLTSTWEKQIEVRARFEVLRDFDGAAVFDRETGLVWERSPAGTATWLTAQNRCNQLNGGGRLGWRLPGLQELASVVDPGVVPPGPMLPRGHPFQNVNVSYPFWTTTGSAAAVDAAWAVNFSSGHVLDVPKTSALFVWCVRGGQGADTQ